MNKKKWVRLALSSLFVLGLVFSLAGPTFASGANENAAPRKIVVFDRLLNPAAEEQLLRKFGATPLKYLPLIDAWVALAGPASEKALQSHPAVLRIDIDAIVYTQAKPTPTPTPPPAEVLPWGVDRIDADLVWSVNTGNAVKVAVVDTGIDLDHPDLQANIKPGINTINPLKSADDDNGHGTHVAGIIAGVDNTVGIIGGAPKAYLYPVKVLNRVGSGWVSDIIEGLDWCITNGMQVVNMSFGTSSDVQSFHDAIIAAYNSGIVLVAAAGNSGPGDNTVLYPAKYAEVIAVSATDSSDAIASWSSRGTEVEVAAPGVNIYSTYKGGGYATLSGTSMACPHVVGTAALVIASGITDSSGNGFINDEVLAKLTGTAEDLGVTGWDSLYGYGLVDAKAATTP